MIKAKNIYKSFGNVKVLKGVNLHIKKGEIVAIVGPSGAGKTTLLQILGTLDRPEKNSDFELTLNNTSLNGISDKEISKFRNQHIGFIFQFHQLLPEFTALENVCIPAFIAKKEKKETEHKAKEILSFLGLEDRYHHKPNQLSGGEQQRVAIARALLNDPELILADEPTGNLDPKTSLEVMELLNEIHQSGKSILMATHDYSLIVKFKQKTIKCEGGELFEVVQQTVN